MFSFLFTDLLNPCLKETGLVPCLQSRLEPMVEPNALLDPSQKVDHHANDQEIEEASSSHRNCALVRPFHAFKGVPNVCPEGEAGQVFDREASS